MARMGLESVDEEWVRQQIASLRAANDSEGLRRLRADITEREERHRLTKTLGDLNSRQRIEQSRAKGMREVYTPEVDLGPEANALRGEAPLPADYKARLDHAIRQGGGGAVGEEPGSRASMGTDIEGALAAGGKEAIRNGKRVIVDDTGRLLATRNESPPLGAATREYFQGKEVGHLDMLSNVLNAPSRAAATGLNYAVARRLGDERATFGNAASDMWGALKGEKEGGVAAGGLRALRGEGYEDYIRFTAGELLERNPQATVADWAKWTAGEGDDDPQKQQAMGMLSEIANRPLSDLGDADYQTMDLFATIAFDPLNFTPGAVISAPLKLAKIPLRMAGKATGATDALAKLRAPLSQAKIADEMAEAGFGADVLDQAETLGEGFAAGQAVAKDRNRLAAELANAPSGAKAEQMVQGERDLRAAQKVLGKLKPKEGRQAVEMAEKLEHANIGRQVEELRKVPAEVVHKMSREDQHVFDVVRQLDDRMVDFMRLGDDALRAVDDDALKAAEEAQRAALELIEPVRRRFHRAATAANRLLPSKQQVNLYEDAAALAERFGTKPRVAEAARFLANTFARRGEAMQELGLLSKSADLAGYVPHIAKGVARYSPMRARKMMPRQDLHSVREAAREIIGELPQGVLSQLARGTANIGAPADEILGAANPEDLPDALKDLVTLYEFVQAPLKRQLELKEPARAIIAKSDTLDDLGTSEELLHRSGAEGWERDARKVLGKYLEKIDPAIATAKAGERIANVKTAGGQNVVRSPAEVLEQVLSAEDQAKYLVRDGSGALTLNERTAKTIANKGDTPAVVRELVDAISKAGYTFLKAENAAKLPSLKGKVVPKWLLPEIDHIVGSQNPESIDQLFKIIGKANRFWVPLLLATPGFHIRNWMYGVGQVYLAAGARAFNPKLATEAHRIAAIAEHGIGSAEKINLANKHLRGARLKDLADELLHYGLVETGKVADMERIMGQSIRYKGVGGKAAGAANLFNPFSEGNIPNILGNAIKRGVNRPLARVSGAGGALGTTSATIENVQRAQVYLAMRARGWSAAESAEHAVKHLFDYTGARLSTAEKSLRQVLPFYQWLKFSNQQIVDAMLTKPARFSNINRVFKAFSLEHAGGIPQDMDPNAQPEWAHRRGGVDIPKALSDKINAFRGKPDDTRRRQWTPERMGPNFIGANPTKMLDTVVEQMGLIPSMAAELASGKFLHGGGTISPGYDRELVSQFEAMVGMRAEDMPGYFGPKLGGPYANLIAAAVRAKNPRRDDVDNTESFVWTLLSMLSGQKIMAFNPLDVAASQTYETEEKLRNAEQLRRAEAKRQSRGISPLDVIIKETAP